jgi:hypothetical protein
MNFLPKVANVITLRKLKAWIVGFITENPKVLKGSVYVGIFLILFLVFLRHEANAETNVQIGPSFVGNRATNAATLIIQETWSNKYGLSLGYIGKQDLDTCGRPDCEWDIDEQIMFGAERIVQGNFDSWAWLNRASFRIGPYWFQNKNRIMSCNFNIRLALAVDITERISIVASHFSNAGSCGEISIRQTNTSQTIIPMYLTGSFNMGQDAIMLMGRF